MVSCSAKIQRQYIKCLQLKKKILITVVGIGPRSSCKGLFVKLNILLVLCLYIFSLIMYLIIWINSKLIRHCMILKLGAKVNYIFFQRNLPLLKKVSLILL